MKHFLLLYTLFIFISCSQTTPIDTELPIAHYLSPSYLKKLDFKGEEIVSVFLGHHYYYVRKDGKVMRTLTYETHSLMV